MYLHMGSGYSVNEKNIIAILNIDYVKNTKDNQYCFFHKHSMFRYFKYM